MTGRYEIVQRILRREGGVADVGDGKGVTRYGQTVEWLREFGLSTPRDADDAAENYTIWMARTRLDRLIAPHGADALADAVIDLAVHSGHTIAILALQRVVGTATDGVIGPATIAAANVDRTRAAAGVVAWRMEQHARLIAGNPARYAKFAVGWARRCAEHVRAIGGERGDLSAKG